MVPSESGPISPRGCLFCLGDDGGFASAEHVLAESLGNTEHLLEPGVVCDRCNNGPLALLDEALVNFPPIQLLRAERGIPTKGGKPAVSTWGNAKVYFERKGTLIIETNSQKASRPTGPSSGTLNLRTGGPMTPQRLARIVRSVWKSALEYMYLDHGPELAFDPFLDEVRALTIGLSRINGWGVLRQQTTTHDRIQLQYQPRIINGVLAVPVKLDVFGVTIYSDLLRRDLSKELIKSELPWGADVWIFDDVRP